MDKKVKGGIAFLVGWIGSSYIAQSVFDYHLNGIYCFLIGLFLYAIFSGAYQEEAEERKAKQQAEQTEKQG